MSAARGTLAIVCVCLVSASGWAQEHVDPPASVQRPDDGNIVVNPGLEFQEQFDWRYGSCAVARRVRTNPHSGAWCLHVRDASDSYGQGNNGRFPVRPGQGHYAEAWVRMDPEEPGGQVSFDVQFYDAADKYLSTLPLGQASSVEWTRLGGKVTVPAGAVTANLRLKPTGQAPGAPAVDVGPLTGACFADDFYFAALADAAKDGRLTTGDGQPGSGRSPRRDALVLHYTFDRDTGDTAEDSSAYGNDGKIAKGEYLDVFDGRRGVLRFDGRESSINCGSPESLYFGGDMSFELWARLNRPVDTDAALVFGYPGPPFFFGRYYVHTLMLKYNCGEGGGEAMRVPVDNRILNDKWSHIAVVVEYPRCRFYHNGALIHDAYMPLPGILKMRNRPKYIGGGPYGGYCPMDLDEFRLYRRALTAAEVAAHARGEGGPPRRAEEIAVEPRWYEKTVAVRLSCKGADYGKHTAEMTLRQKGTGVAAPQTAVLGESFEASGRYVAEVTFPLSGLAGKSLDAVVHILGPDGRLVKKLNRRASLEKPDWVHTTEGYSDDVMPPWTPVEAEQAPDGTVELSVWGRRYVLGAAPFPRQIETRGEQILASPVSLNGVAEGKPIAWRGGRARLKGASKTAAALEQTFEGDGATLRIDTSIEYDGYMIFACELRARRDLSVESLLLDIPLRARYAALCLGMDVFPPDRKIPMNKNYSGAVRGDLAFRFASSVWLGDEERGLCWQAESDEDWHYAEEQKAIEILPRGETTTFRANLVNVPTRLAADEAFHYTFALQATPIRPMLRDSWDLRVVRSDPYGEDLSLPDRQTNGKPTLQYYADAGVRRLFINVTTLWPYPMPPGKLYQDALRRLIKETHAHGLKLHNYLIHQRYPILAPEYDIHGLHMTRRPLDTYTPGGVVENADGTPAAPHRYHGPVSTHYGAGSQGSVGFCAKSMAARDAIVHSLARRLDAYGEDGAYLDGTGYVVACRNLVHGCGYRRADGSVRTTYDTFAERELMRRIYTVFKQRDPDAVLDVHQSFGQNTAALAYADILWTGEHWWHLKHTGAKDGYISAELPLDMFRTEFMGYATGVATEVLAYRLMGGQSQLGGRKKVSAIGLLHDVPVRARTQDKEWFGFMSTLWGLRDEFGAKEAEKLFYWNSQDYVRVAPKQCYATLLRHPTNGVLAFISNLRRDAQTVIAELNLRKLGLRGRELDVFDALTSEPVAMSPEGKVSVSLESEHWVYVWLRPKPR